MTTFSFSLSVCLSNLPIFATITCKSVCLKRCLCDLDLCVVSMFSFLHTESFVLLTAVIVWLLNQCSSSVFDLQRWSLCLTLLCWYRGTPCWFSSGSRWSNRWSVIVVEQSLMMLVDQMCPAGSA